MENVLRAVFAEGISCESEPTRLHTDDEGGGLKKKKSENEDHVCSVGLE